VEFTKEFFSDLVMPTPGGGSATVFEALGTQYKCGILTGQIQELLYCQQGEVNPMNDTDM